MRFWNSRVAAPIGLTGWPSDATEAALVPEPGVSATGFFASAVAVPAADCSVVARSHAPRAKTLSRTKAEQSLVIANLLLQVLCQRQRRRSSTAQVAAMHITLV